jgi:hypothetical protein
MQPELTGTYSAKHCAELDKRFVYGIIVDPVVGDQAESSF